MGTDSWTAGQALWTVLGDWSTKKVPTTTDDVTVDNGGMADPIIRSSVNGIQSLAIGPTSGADGAEVEVGAGGSLAVSGDVSQRGVLAVDARGNLTVGGTLNDPNGDVTVLGSLTATNIVVGGDTSVGSGNNFLILDGTVTAPITVDSGLTLAGKGTINGAVTIGSGATYDARPSATNTADPLNIDGNLTLDSGAITRAELDGATPGAFSQTNVSGTITLAGTLKVADFGFTATPGSTFDIISGSSPIVGTFDGLPEGATVVGTKNSYTISYKGDDVVLTATGPACFVTGTGIRTSNGDVAVEDLRGGEFAVTVSGALRPVIWIGHRDLECRGRPDLCPVRVAAHAFGENRPARDLMLSPGHLVLVGAGPEGEGGCLMPIMHLINGTTIERVVVDKVTYWHVELDAHDILLAEGLPAESYLDWGDRAFFDEGSDHALANPDFVVPGLAGRCRPVALDGPAVEAERSRLDMVFATQLVGACAWPDEASVARGDAGL